MQRNVGRTGQKIGIFIFLLAFMLLGQSLSAQNAGYLDYLDSYYQDGNQADLELAKNSIKSELDSSLALKIQSYYYNAEIEYLLAYEKLNKDPLSEEKGQNLKNLLVELYYRYLESYYHFKKGGIKSSSLEGNTAYLFKDIFLAATIMKNATSVAPLVSNLLRRANRENLFNTENSFVASVNDIFSYENPNLFGVANMLKAVWTYDRYMQADESSITKDSLQHVVNYHSAISLDTLQSNFGKSIACFLLATTNSDRDYDAAWNYFQKCLEYSDDASEFPTTGFYAKNYNYEIYLATSVAYLPAYCEYLFDKNRYAEIVQATEYFVETDKLDQGMLENVSKEAIFWGEKAIRALQVESRYEDSDDIYRRLHAFYKFLQPDETFSGQPED
jgi:hypothetical protein